MASELRTISQILEVTEVSDVIYTDVQPDGSGGFVRAFRFYGPAAIGSDGTGPLLLEIRARSDDQNALALTTKPLTI